MITESDNVLEVDPPVGTSLSLDRPDGDPGTAVGPPTRPNGAVDVEALLSHYAPIGRQHRREMRRLKLRAALLWFGLAATGVVLITVALTTRMPQSQPAAGAQVSANGPGAAAPVPAGTAGGETAVTGSAQQPQPGALAEAPSTAADP